jgi:hypothetical protein
MIANQAFRTHFIPCNSLGKSLAHPPALVPNSFSNTISTHWFNLVEEAAAVAAVGVDPRPHNLHPCRVEKHADGTRANFVLSLIFPAAVGQYQLSVQVKGQHITGSPFAVTVTASASNDRDEC